MPFHNHSLPSASLPQDVKFLKGRNDAFLLFVFIGPAIQSRLSGYLMLEHPAGNKCEEKK